MKKIIFLVSALIVVMLTGCATTNGVKSHCQGETAIFLRNNLDPDTIIIEDASTEHYSGNSYWYFWTAITPTGSIYKCQAFSGDKTRYCRKLKINNSEKKAKSSQTRNSNK
jgi:hypothetical protein